MPFCFADFIIIMGADTLGPEGGPQSFHLQVKCDVCGWGTPGWLTRESHGTVLYRYRVQGEESSGQPPLHEGVVNASIVHSSGEADSQ